MSTQWIDPFIVMRWPSFIPGNIFALKSTLTDTILPISALFWLTLAWNIFFFSILLVLSCLCLNIQSKCAPHIVGSYYFYSIWCSLPLKLRCLNNLYLIWLLIELCFILPSCYLFSACHVWFLFPFSSFFCLLLD